MLNGAIPFVIESIDSKQAQKFKTCQGIVLLFDDINVKTSELSFTKDKLVNKSSYSESLEEPITLPFFSVTDSNEETESAQINEANFNDFKFDEFKVENDDNENTNETIEVTTTTTIAPTKDIIDKKKEEFML